jgi:hypothetical protein
MNKFPPERSEVSQKSEVRDLSVDCFNPVDEYVHEFVSRKKALNLRPYPLEKCMEISLPQVPDSQVHDPGRGRRKQNTV